MYDAIIVGAGPAGSAAATRLAQKGWQVLLLDKATFPRDKVCGDMVSPRSQRVLHALGCAPALEELCPNRVNAGAFYLHGDTLMSAKVPHVEDLTNYGYVVPRVVFDEIIFRRAQEVGTHTVEGCKVTSLSIASDGVIVWAEHKGKSCSFGGRLVIGADGAHSVVARNLGLGIARRRGAINRAPTLALRAYYEGVESDPSQVDIFFDERYFPGYAWMFPLGWGRANVGMGVIVDPAQRRQTGLREHFLQWLANDPIAQARLGRARQVGRIVGWPLNTYSPMSRNYAERALLIGDAANLVNPINGEGIHTALESACIAAEVADEALRADNLSADFLSRYEQRWQAAFDLDLRTADLFVTIAGNRALTGLWLSILKMIGDTARRDRSYARTVVGILAGVTPTHRSLSPKFIVKTLLHSPSFYRRALNLPTSGWPISLVYWGLMSCRNALTTSRKLAAQPSRTARWGRDVSIRGISLLSPLAKDAKRRK